MHPGLSIFLTLPFLHVNTEKADQARLGNEAVYQVPGEMHDIVGQARVSKVEQVVY